jgi:hypothetical protein
MPLRFISFSPLLFSRHTPLRHFILIDLRHYHLILQIIIITSINCLHYAIDITPLLPLPFHIAVIATLRFSSLMADFIISPCRRH